MNALDWGILIAYALVNLVAFALMGLDKRIGLQMLCGMKRR